MEVQCIRRGIDTLDHRRRANLFHRMCLHVNQSELAGRVILQQVRLIWIVEQTCIVAFRIFHRIHRQSHNRAGGDIGTFRLRLTAVRQQYDDDALAVRGPINRVNECRQERSLSNGGRLSGGNVGHVELRCVLEIGDKRKLFAVRRPARVARRGVLGQLDRCGLAGDRVDQLQPNRTASSQCSHPICLEIDLESAEVVVRLSERRDAGQSLTLFLQEMSAVRARLRERHIQVTRRRDEFDDFRRRRDITLLGEQLPVGGDLRGDAGLGVLGGKRQGRECQRQCAQECERDGTA